MRQGSLLVGLFIGIVFGSRSSEAQYTADFQTNIISGVFSNWSGDYYVGRTNSADVLLIQNSGGLQNVYGFVSYFASGGSNNSVVVADTGSYWLNSGPLIVGGSGNSLVITNGGQISCLYFSVSGSNNKVVITDTGSWWYAGQSMSSGINGLSNSLVIANGGRMDNVDFIAGGGCYSLGDGCNVRVTGPGSVLNTLGGLYVGMPIGNYGSITPTCGSGHSLVISNGGRVISGRGYAGYRGTNTVLITGAGSVWDNFDNVYVGSAGSDNSFVIRDGGRMINRHFGYIGGDPEYSFDGANGNRVVVTGTGSSWSNNSSSINIGYAGASNSLLISNNAQVLSLGGNVGVGSSSSNNCVRVVDGGVWRSRISSLTVGVQGSGNSVIVAGGSVIAPGLLIGSAPTLCNNLVELDSGSLIVTNATTNAVLEVRLGKFIINGGTLQVDRFVMTNSCAQFVRTGGTLIYGIAVLDPNRDDDGDGILNDWEQAHGLDPLNADDAGVDYDGDGLTNLQEYLAGTEPTNSASTFRIVEFAALEDDVLLTWTTVGGKKYAVQGVDGNYTNNFFNFEPVIIAPGTGESMFSVIDLGAATNVPGRFYRVRLVP